MDSTHYYYIVDTSSKKKYYNILTGKQVSAYSIKNLIPNVQHRELFNVQLKKLYHDKKVLTQKLNEITSALNNIDNALLTFTESQKQEYVNTIKNDNQLKRMYLSGQQIGSDDDVIYPKI